MKKQPLITDATRQDFVYAFCQLHSQRPIEKITVKEIAERAGYSRATFYNYFKDPYDLLEYIEEKFVSSFSDAIRENLAQGKLLDGYLYTFNKLINENEMYYQVLLSNSHNLHYSKRLQDAVIPLAMEAFKVSADNRKALYAFRFYFPGVISIISSWLKNGKDIPIEDLVDIIKGILEKGLLAQLT